MSHRKHTREIVADMSLLVNLRELVVSSQLFQGLVVTLKDTRFMPLCTVVSKAGL